MDMVSKLLLVMDISSLCSSFMCISKGSSRVKKSPQKEQMRIFLILTSFWVTGCCHCFSFLGLHHFCSSGCCVHSSRQPVPAHKRRAAPLGNATCCSAVASGLLPQRHRFVLSALILAVALLPWIPSPTVLRPSWLLEQVKGITCPKEKGFIILRVYRKVQDRQHQKQHYDTFSCSPRQVSWSLQLRVTRVKKEG